MKVIRFKKEQSCEMISMFDESMLGSWHIVPPPLDYTACGHATDEYNTETKEGNVTCKDCLEVVRFYKKLKL